MKARKAKHSKTKEPLKVKTASKRTRASRNTSVKEKSDPRERTLGDVRAFKAVIKLNSEAVAFSEKMLKRIIRESMLDFSRSETHALINALRIGAASLVLRKKLKPGQFLKYRNEIFKKWSAPTLNRYLALAKRLPEIGKLPSNTNLTEVYRLLGITKGKERGKESASHTQADAKKHPSQLPVRADDLRAYAETMEPDKMEEGERLEMISELKEVEQVIQEFRTKLMRMRRGSEFIADLNMDQSTHGGAIITRDKSGDEDACNPDATSTATTDSQAFGTQG